MVTREQIEEIQAESREKGVSVKSVLKEKGIPEGQYFRWRRRYASGDVPGVSIPELTNNTTYGTGYFAPLSFGVDGCNHAWIAWGVDDLFGAPKFSIGTGEQRLVSEGRYCCGFSFVTKGYKEGSYTTIYQFNYNNKWVYDGTTGGGYFAKK